LSKPLTIAIDGSAASGKSTVGALLAQRLGYLYFDTGVMYRAITWAALNRNIDPRNREFVSALAETLVIEVNPNGCDDGRLYTVLADGQDITWQIRSPEVDAFVSLVSSYPRVRAALTAQQRRIAAAGFIVMVGRDIGTVVLPGADLKVFMRASAEERARRRYDETLAQGKPANFEEILRAMQERDKQDREKPISPMIPAPDAIIIETDHLSVEQVLAQVEQLITASLPVGQKSEL
jgi:cytidylate kinase